MKTSINKISLSFFVAFFLFNSLTAQVIIPVADLCVSHQNPDYIIGKNDLLYVAGSPKIYSFLKFDLKSINSNVSKAYIRLKAKKYAKEFHIQAVSDDRLLTDSTTNWLNQPETTYEFPLDTRFVDNDGFITFDVTTFTKSQLYTDKIASFRIESEANSPRFSFYSSESDYPPQLLIETLQIEKIELSNETLYKSLHLPMGNNYMDHVIYLPGKNNQGWAIDPKTEPIQNAWIPYACEAGYYATQFNEAQGIPSHGNGWTIENSLQGLYIDKDGYVHVPKTPLCKKGGQQAYLVNNLHLPITICQTVYPGTEIPQIPTTTYPGDTVLVTTFPDHYWHDVSAHYYVNLPGVHPEKACRWEESTITGVSKSPYVLGGNITDFNGGTSWHNLTFGEGYIAQNGDPGFGMKVEKKLSNGQILTPGNFNRKVINEELSDNVSGSEIWYDGNGVAQCTPAANISQNEKLYFTFYQNHTDVFDCSNRRNGTAQIDACGYCAGGKTGVSADKCLECEVSQSSVGESTLAIDNDLNTVWSTSDHGESITFCFDEERNTDYIDILFSNNETTHQFDLLVSIDGSRWQAIKYYSSVNSTTNWQRIEFKKMRFKKIKIVNRNAQFKPFGIIEIEDNLILSHEKKEGFYNFQIYPNPAYNKLNIKNTYKNQNGFLKITNIVGKEILKLDYLPSQLTIREFEKGLYIMEFHIGNVIEKQTFVKN